jgi:hypothetical protein
MVKRRTYLLIGLCCALVLLALPAAASAQSCSTAPTYLGSSSYNTNCSNGGSCTTAPTYLGSSSYDTSCNNGRSCNTSPTYLGSSSYDTTCNGTSPYSNAFAQLYLLEAQQQYLRSLANSVPPPPPALPTPPVDQGITLNLTTGGQNYLARGTFVKIGDAPAIYWVYGAQLHSFTTWPQFLNAGGKSDLSNVVGFSYIGDTAGTMFGQPVQP